MSVREKRKFVGLVKLNKWFVSEDHHNDSTRCLNAGNLNFDISYF